jgi:hypothetical protein
VNDSRTKSEFSNVLKKLSQYRRVRCFDDKTMVSAYSNHSALMGRSSSRRSEEDEEYGIPSVRMTTSKSTSIHSKHHQYVVDSTSHGESTNITRSVSMPTCIDSDVSAAKKKYSLNHHHAKVIRKQMKYYNRTMHQTKKNANDVAQYKNEQHLQKQNEQNVHQEGYKNNHGTNDDNALYNIVSSLSSSDYYSVSDTQEQNDELQEYEDDDREDEDEVGFDFSESNASNLRSINTSTSSYFRPVTRSQRVHVPEGSISTRHEWKNNETTSNLTSAERQCSSQSIHGTASMHGNCDVKGNIHATEMQKSSHSQSKQIVVVRGRDVVIVSAMNSEPYPHCANRNVVREDTVAIQQQSAHSPLQTTSSVSSSTGAVSSKLEFISHTKNKNNHFNEKDIRTSLNEPRDFVENGVVMATSPTSQPMMMDPILSIHDSMNSSAHPTKIRCERGGCRQVVLITSNEENEYEEEEEADNGEKSSVCGKDSMSISTKEAVVAAATEDSTQLMSVCSRASNASNKSGKQKVAIVGQVHDIFVEATGDANDNIIDHPNYHIVAPASSYLSDHPVYYATASKNMIPTSKFDEFETQSLPVGTINQRTSSSKHSRRNGSNAMPACCDNNYTQLNAGLRYITNGKGESRNLGTSTSMPFTNQNFATKMFHQPFLQVRQDQNDTVSTTSGRSTCSKKNQNHFTKEKCHDIVQTSNRGSVRSIVSNPEYVRNVEKNNNEIDLYTESIKGENESSTTEASMTRLKRDQSMKVENDFTEEVMSNSATELVHIPINDAVNDENEKLSLPSDLTFSYLPHKLRIKKSNSTFETMGSSCIANSSSWSVNGRMMLSSSSLSLANSQNYDNENSEIDGEVLVPVNDTENMIEHRDEINPRENDDEFSLIGEVKCENSSDSSKKTNREDAECANSSIALQKSFSKSDDKFSVTSKPEIISAVDIDDRSRKTRNASKDSSIRSVLNPCPKEDIRLPAMHNDDNIQEISLGEKTSVCCHAHPCLELTTLPDTDRDNTSRSVCQNYEVKSDEHHSKDLVNTISTSRHQNSSTLIMDDQTFSFTPSALVTETVASDAASKSLDASSTREIKSILNQMSGNRGDYDSRQCDTSSNRSTGNIPTTIQVVNQDDFDFSICSVPKKSPAKTFHSKRIEINYDKIRLRDNDSPQPRSHNGRIGNYENFARKASRSTSFDKTTSSNEIMAISKSTIHESFEKDEKSLNRTSKEIGPIKELKHSMSFIRDRMDDIDASVEKYDNYWHRQDRSTILFDEESFRSDQQHTKESIKGKVEGSSHKRNYKLSNWDDGNVNKDNSCGQSTDSARSKDAAMSINSNRMMSYDKASCCPSSNHVEMETGASSSQAIASGLRNLIQSASDLSRNKDDVESFSTNSLIPLVTAKDVTESPHLLLKGSQQGNTLSSNDRKAIDAPESNIVNLCWSNEELHSVNIPVIRVVESCEGLSYDKEGNIEKKGVNKRSILSRVDDLGRSNERNLDPMSRTSGISKYFSPLAILESQSNLQRYPDPPCATGRDIYSFSARTSDPPTTNIFSKYLIPENKTLPDPEDQRCIQDQFKGAMIAKRVEKYTTDITNKSTNMGHNTKMISTSTIDLFSAKNSPFETNELLETKNSKKSGRSKSRIENSVIDRVIVKEFALVDLVETATTNENDVLPNEGGEPGDRYHVDWKSPQKENEEIVRQSESVSVRSALTGLEGLTPVLSMKVKAESIIVSPKSSGKYSIKRINRHIARPSSPPISRNDKKASHQKTLPVPCIDLSGSIDVSGLDHPRGDEDTIDTTTAEGNTGHDRYVPNVGDFKSSLDDGVECLDDTKISTLSSTNLNQTITKENSHFDCYHETNQETFPRPIGKNMKTDKLFLQQSLQSHVIPTADEPIDLVSIMHRRKIQPSKIGTKCSKRDKSSVIAATNKCPQERGVSGESEQGLSENIVVCNTLNHNKQRSRRHKGGSDRPDLSTSTIDIVPAKNARKLIGDNSNDSRPCTETHSVVRSKKHHTDISNCDKLDRSSSYSPLLPGVDDYERKRKLWRRNRDTRSRVTFDNIITELSLEVLDSQESSEAAMDALFASCNQSPIAQSITNKIFGLHWS